MRFLPSIILLSTLAACAAPPGSAGDHPVQCPLDGGQPASLDTAIHDYLLAHGDVVLQALQENGKRQQAAQMEQSRQALAGAHAALFDDATDPVAGNPAGGVTVVEFFDAECPFCKKVAPDLERLIAENSDIRVVYKEYPILGPGSVTAAKAALAAVRQGKYEAFHNALMADATPEHQLTEALILEIAKQRGLDVKRLTSDMQAPEIAAKITANVTLARQIGVNGTPALIIGDRLIPGAMPYDALVQAVSEVRQRN
ncbi:DsbA family protein [Telmatospirillum sp.]|uniref:DsbA family protein n=1 Tax=Telmatospirillum sp. TaxID=2079197 RepID=UPI002847571B|nr:DsbA family protein [Telmatospirillum sp.]MDR3438195.1 DsbA family protein [Telmatospirillum sp.]